MVTFAAAAETTSTIATRAPVQSLSEVGDWDSVTTNGTTETGTHGPTHELLTAGGNSVSTDTKGNITLIPVALRPNASSLSMNWDFDIRLNTADVGNNNSIDVTYKFDAMGRRVFRDDGTTAMVYVQSGQQTIADYTASSAPSSPIYRYVYASYIDEPVLRFKLSGSESLYYHRNQQYSVVALTDGSAAIVERYSYSAYGVPTITNASGTVLTLGSVDNRYMYTGREWDQALSLYHYRARMYDANLGRFASRDPIRYLGSPNLFEMNIFLVSIDPQGYRRQPVSCEGVLVRYEGQMPRCSVHCACPGFQAHPPIEQLLIKAMTEAEWKEWGLPPPWPGSYETQCAAVARSFENSNICPDDPGPPDDDSGPKPTPFSDAPHCIQSDYVELQVAAFAAGKCYGGLRYGWRCVRWRWVSEPVKQIPTKSPLVYPRKKPLPLKFPLEFPANTAA